MSKYKSEGSSGGIGILDVVQIVLIILKLVGVIKWSWWIVLIPLWITLGMIALFVVIMWINELQYRSKPAKRK